MNPVTVNTKEGTALVDGNVVSLKRTEVKILNVLSKEYFITDKNLRALYSGRDFSAKECGRVWISHIRKKLGRDAIITKHYAGYKLGEHIFFVDAIPEAVRHSGWLAANRYVGIVDGGHHPAFFTVTAPDVYFTPADLYKKWVELGKP